MLFIFFFPSQLLFKIGSGIAIPKNVPLPSSKSLASNKNSSGLQNYHSKLLVKGKNFELHHLFRYEIKKGDTEAARALNGDFDPFKARVLEHPVS